MLRNIEIFVNFVIPNLDGLTSIRYGYRSQDNMIAAGGCC